MTTEERKAYNLAWRQKHPNYHKDWALAHPRICDQQKNNEASRRRNANPDRIAYMKKYRLGNPVDRQAYKKNYDEANKEKIREYWDKNNARFRAFVFCRKMQQYGVPASDWDRLREQTICDCCGETPAVELGRIKAVLCIDHDHKTGLFRGMLCVHCNCMLGFSRENVKRLTAGVKYLSHHTKTGGVKPGDEGR